MYIVQSEHPVNREIWNNMMVQIKSQTDNVLGLKETKEYENRDDMSRMRNLRIWDVACTPATVGS